jgi:hypothetical protein
MGPVTLTAGTLQLSDTLIYAATSTSNAITQVAGSVLTLNNCQTLPPTLDNVSRNSFGGYYSILHSVYDKANSTFDGVSLNSISYSQYINANRLTIETATPSTSTTTGAIVVAGGVGIGLDLWVGGTIYRNGTSIGYGYTGSAGTGYTGSASTVAGFTGSAGAGYTGSASTVAGYTGSTGFTGSIGFVGSIGPAIASGQTYQNVTGSRAGDTNYTNSTGKPIWVWYSATSATGGAVTQAYVDSNLACYTSMDLYPRAFAGFMVPAGSTYSITLGGNLSYWLELR